MVLLYSQGWTTITAMWFKNISMDPEQNLVHISTHFLFLFSPSPWQSLIHFLSAWICLFWTVHMIWTELYKMCPVVLGFFHVFKVYPHCSMYHNFVLFYGWILSCYIKSHFVYLFISWWILGFFYLLAIVNIAVRKMCIHVSVWVPVFNLLDILSRSRISEPYGNYMFIFSRNKHSHRACPFTFISPVCEDSNFSTASSILIIFLLKNYYYRHLTSLVGISGTSLWLSFPFPWQIMKLSMFSCAY